MKKTGTFHGKSNKLGQAGARRNSKPRAFPVAS